MQGEDRAISQNGGKGSTGEAVGGGNELRTVVESINAIKGVVGDLVTQVSNIERSVQESRDLAEIMRTTVPQEDYEDQSQFERQPSPKQQSQTAKPAVDEYAQVLDRKLAALNRRMDDVVAQFQVKQLELAKPDFNTVIRPLAYQISKEPGMDRLSVEQITSIAEGRLAQKRANELNSQIADMKTKLEELESRAMGDRPGMFVGIEEPPKKMSSEEAFDDAFKKSGLDRMMR